MEPVPGPWQYTYNRLAGVQGAASNELHHHFAQAATNSALSGHNSAVGVPSTTSQLLLQAAHSASPAFNPSSFLNAPTVSYDAMFSPFLHHQPKPAHFNAINAQHRQVIAQAQAQAAVTKQATEVELIRENYSQQHQTLAAHSGSYFDQSVTPVSAASLAWQGNNQLPSPFGILPHESVVPLSPGPSTTKSSATAAAVYENFNTHFAAQPLNHVNAILKSTARAPSPQLNANKSTAVSSAPNSGTYYHTSLPYGATGSLQSNYSPNSKQSTSQQQHQQQLQQSVYTNVGSKSYSTSTGSSSSSQINQQSCIVSTPSSPSKDYRVSSQIIPTTHASISSMYISNSTSKTEKASCRPAPANLEISDFIHPPSKPPTPHQIQTKAQTKIYPDYVSSNNVERRVAIDEKLLQQQSSPISFSIIDASGRLNYSGSNSSAKNAATARNNNSVNVQQQSQTQYQQSASNYRQQFASGSDAQEYALASRTKANSSTESQYSSNSAQNGSKDCGASVVVPRRPSPLQSNSQASPLGHVPSPAYPMYNSPLNSMASPQTSDHQQSQNAYKSTTPNQHMAPRSPLDVSVSVSRPPSQGVGYSSVITRALINDQTKSYTDPRYERPVQQSTNQQQQQQQQRQCWDNDRVTSQQQQVRKFQGNAYSSNVSQTSSNHIVDMHQGSPQQPNQQSQSILSNIQQPQVLQRNYETTVTPVAPVLQDLSSCRASDSMAIIKSMQIISGHQSQNCQINQQQIQQQQQQSIVETKPAKITGARKRKTPAEKVRDSVTATTAASAVEPAPTASSDYLNSRIPPPAHTTSQQQPIQNGAYFEIERWNLPPPPPKNFPTSSAFTPSQSSIHNSNFNSQQSFMVPHIHTHTPLPYLPAFHLPHHPDYQLSDISSSTPSAIISNSNFNNNSTGTTSVSSSNYSLTPETREDEPPKVVVPNIEEELGFLAENNRSGSNSAQQQQQTSNNRQAQQSQPTQLNRPANNVTTHTSHQQQLPAQTQPTTSNAPKVLDNKFKPSGPGAGFMGSYLKFLQGERDTSPPPANRGNRKTSWTRPAPTSTSTSATTTNTAAGTNVKQLNQVSNGMIAQQPISNNQTIQQQTQQTQQQKIDEDQRYYQSPKDRKRAADDEFTKQQINSTTPSKKQPATKKARTNSQLQQQQSQQQQQQQPHQQQQQILPPQQQQQLMPNQSQAITQYQMSQHLQQQQPPQMMQQMYYQQPDEGVLSSYFDLHMRRQRW